MRPERPLVAGRGGAGRRPRGARGGSCWRRSSSTRGDRLFIVNQELRFPLPGDWFSGLVFFDAGDVWESREAIDSGLFKSVGLGLRASTPAGPLRFDVAFPLDRRDGDDRVKVYFGFGHVF